MASRKGKASAAAADSDGEATLDYDQAARDADAEIDLGEYASLGEQAYESDHLWGMKQGSTERDYFADILHVPASRFQPNTWAEQEFGPTGPDTPDSWGISAHGVAYVLIKCQVGLWDEKKKRYVVVSLYDDVEEWFSRSECETFNTNPTPPKAKPNRKRGGAVSTTPHRGLGQRKRGGGAGGLDLDEEGEDREDGMSVPSSANDSDEEESEEESESDTEAPYERAEGGEEGEEGEGGEEEEEEDVEEGDDPLLSPNGQTWSTDPNAGFGRNDPRGSTPNFDPKMQSTGKSDDPRDPSKSQSPKAWYEYMYPHRVNLKDKLMKQINKRLRIKRRTVTPKTHAKYYADLFGPEFEVWEGVLLALTFKPPGTTRDEMWSSPLRIGLWQSLNLGRFMPRPRFDAIMWAFQLEGEGEPNDPWRRVRFLIDEFNDFMPIRLMPGTVVTIDESMWQARWRAGVPHTSKEPNKPRPVGIELKTLGDAKSYVLIQMELCECKEDMAKKVRVRVKVGVRVAINS